ARRRCLKGGAEPPAARACLGAQRAGGSVGRMLRASPIIYAHRGSSFELPENTLESFALALEVGADALETDAHMTRDGRIVLSHDPSGMRMAGVDRLIRHATLDEVRRWDVGARFVPRRSGAFVPGTRFQ